MAENATTSALKKAFAKTANFGEIEGIVDVIPFSSERKCSGFRTKKEEYLMGAIEFITDDKEVIKKVKSYAGDYRVIGVVKVAVGATSPAEHKDLARAARSVSEGHAAPTATFLGCIRLKDEIRKNAPEIIKYFYDNDIAPKVISGDDLETVKKIAATVGIKDLRGVDLSTEKKPNYENLVKNYSIFTRVKPEQKKSLIEAFKKAGGTVAMTGDGVNDILAMKEADCSIAIGEGSDAARRSAKLVLLDSDFDRVPSIIDEGRQSINNLERSTSLFLAKTVYATTLAVIFVLAPLSYPFSPIEMSLLSFACIGFPGLALALEHNTARIKDKFIYNIKHYSMPTGIAVAISMVVLSIVAEINNFDRSKLTTLSAIIVFTIDFFLIYKISRPLNLFRAILMALILAIFLGALFIPATQELFEFTLAW